MATCGRCLADVPVPPHVTAGRMRCRSCGESVDVAEPPPRQPASPPSPGATARPGTRMPGAGGPPQAAPVGLVRTCVGCGARYPAEQGTRCPHCGTDSRRLREAAAEGDGWAPERAGLSAGVVGGIAMIAIACIWFFVGYEAGIIFYYPPLLALLGVFGIVKGLAEGNLAGERRETYRTRRPPRRPRRGRR